MKKFILLIFVFPVSVVALAQQELTLQFMNTIPQSTYTNPAIVPQYNGYFGLPGISSVYLSAFNSGFSYNDVFERRADDSLTVKLKSLNDGLEERNYIINEQSVDLLSLGARANPRLYINFNITARNYEMLEYPNDLTAFFVEGNGRFIGETINLSMDGDALSFIETGLGASYVINNDLTLGLKLKYLSGIANANTENAEFSLFTDEFYQLTFSGEASIQTSGINQLTDENFDPDVDNIQDVFKNSGYAVDFGGTYNISDEIVIGASILNLGTIKWKNDVTTYTLDQDTTEFTYEGLDVQKLINDEDEFDALVDSLETSFEFVENNDASAYNAPIPTRIYVNGSYKLPMNAQVGVAFFGEKYGKILKGGVGVVANKKFGKIFDFSLSYSIRKNTYNNFGAGLALRLPPFQIYATGDNLLGAPIYPNDIKNVNLRFGINMVFDWYKPESAIPYSQM